MLAKQLYPDRDSDGCFCSSGDYDPIIKYAGKILVRHDDDSYSGDTFALISKDNCFGLMMFGWGSCSGCDALQGCSSYKELNELIFQLLNDILWFDSLKEVLTWLGSDGPTLQWYGSDEGFKQFVEKVLVFSEASK